MDSFEPGDIPDWVLYAPMSLLVLAMPCGDVPFTAKWNRGKLNPTGPLTTSFLATDGIVVALVMLRQSDAGFAAAMATAGVLALTAYFYVRNPEGDADRLID